MSISLPGGNCWLAHDLNNKLAIVVGQCELLMGRVVDREYTERLQGIRAAAQAMAESLKRHQCELADLLRQVQHSQPGSERESLSVVSVQAGLISSADHSQDTVRRRTQHNFSGVDGSQLGFS